MGPLTSLPGNAFLGEGNSDLVEENIEPAAPIRENVTSESSVRVEGVSLVEPSLGSLGTSGEKAAEAEKPRNFFDEVDVSELIHEAERAVKHEYDAVAETWRKWDAPSVSTSPKLFFLERRFLFWWRRRASVRVPCEGHIG